MARLTVRTMAALLMVSAISAAAPRAPAPALKRTPEALARAEGSVKEKLEKLKGTAAAVQYVKDEAVESALPRHYLFSVLFRQFPVARPVPEGLRSSNLFAVDAEGEVALLTDVKALEKFFHSNLAAARGEAQRRTALLSWLRLTQQYHQDGFYTFGLVGDAVRVEARSARGTVAAMRGGSGTLSATLTFDEDGKLDKVSEEAKLRPGPRPICQASKLLDRDPLVRRIAEQDLLIMGRAAEDYLHEQRGKADADLRRTIDRVLERIRHEER